MNRPDICRLLLNAGADVNVIRKKEILNCVITNTPLMFACFFGFLEIVELLLNADANMNLVDHVSFNICHLSIL